MSQAVPLPNPVASVVADYRRRLDAEGMPVLQGLYLVGSVALDDFRPGASDIDFVAVLDREPATRDCAALERVHAGLAEAGGACFDGFYLTAEALGRVPTQYVVLPFSLDGRFRTGEVCREVNPVVWRCLARHGRTAFGPPPSELGIADDGDALRTYQVGNLREYWLSWITQAEAGLAWKAPGEDANAGALAWGVLGVARIACALETGGVVSKDGGGRHALVAHPARWHPVIREALAAHAGVMGRVPVETVREGLAYMRFAIAAATAGTGRTRAP
ncbi:aminoglycoside adenylyltransferase domain-containing protein [Methylobacterium sp. J-068]|uniref:aminoglycoside adenylyltransferase domain-containing protein n=1 Tax=Methylobacterium sp. J-068 TaxID=2836649 RepID=UPI001FBAE1FC|nr:aminoglycoside adenylyltransferase domain-containing protein [Methylobacterium sp. J-068]MCJ2033839.1 DUF4111 domain-containing protein [Methylobacterium sp. J-068]